MKFSFGEVRGLDNLFLFSAVNDSRLEINELERIFSALSLSNLGTSQGVCSQGRARMSSRTLDLARDQWVGFELIPLNISESPL